MNRPDWAPQEIDLERPSAARVYDCLLGGSHNFAIDRMLAQKMRDVFPEVTDDAAANRAFLRRAVRCCVDAGIRQFIDVGSGIPTVGNVHEVAQQLAPGAHVVYVDIDPVAVTHSRAILANNPGTAVIQADFCQPSSILDDPGVRELIDFEQPVALLLVALLHFVSDAQDPSALTDAYARHMAPDSHLVISHMRSDTNPDVAAKLALLAGKTSTPGTMRSKVEITGLFDGWSLLEPGVTPASLWRPDSAQDVDESIDSALVYAGVGRKEPVREDRGVSVPQRTAGEEETARS